MKQAANQAFNKLIFFLLIMYILVVYGSIYILRKDGFGFGYWKIFAYDCLPLLGATLSCVFYTMGNKLLYIISAVIPCTWIFVWWGILGYIGGIAWFYAYGLLLMTVILGFPLLDLLFRHKTKFRIVYLISAVVLTAMADIKVVCWVMYSGYVDTLWRVNYAGIRIILVGCMVAATIFSLGKAERDEVEGEFVVLTGVTALVYAFMLLFCIKYSFLLLTVEFGTLFFILLIFAVDYVFDRTVRICYLGCSWLVIIGKEILVWYLENAVPYYMPRYLRGYGIESVLILLFATVYTLKVKEKGKITFDNSIRWLILCLTAGYVFYSI